MDYNIEDILPERVKKSWNAFTPQGRAKTRHDLMLAYPDDEIWDYLEYYRYNPYNKEMVNSHFIERTILISNKGNIKRTTGEKVIPWVTTQGYLIAWAREQEFRFLVHRAVCLMYNVVPLKIFEIDYACLQVNHLDGDKKNPAALNLEWSTPKQNNQHAVETGLRAYKTGIDNHRSIPVLVTVKIEGQYKDFKFIIAGTSESDELKFNNNHLKFINVKDKLVKGCLFEIADDLDIELYSNPIPAELIQLIRKYKGSSKGLIIGTNLKTGETKTFNGLKEIEAAGFNNGEVYSCCNGRREKHKGWTFKRIDT
ncbi:HNH endonuclease [Erwinia phage vB_EamM_Joad]|uniref:HNH endonuclease n=1 Tax=Erwinia phage vB_EamM_Joad TaxID=2026081 RepID=A0A223LIV8_9CAUD|nr:HNH endonuclease [Erwinia phage vB_EamM_Joad]